MTPTTRPEPLTEAGKRLLAWPGAPNDMLVFILAIENQAAELVAIEAEAARPDPVASEGAIHEHYWVDAPDDETGWHCTICGLTEYPGESPDRDLLAEFEAVIDALASSYDALRGRSQGVSEALTPIFGPDARLIAAAVTALPALLRVARAAEEVAEQVGSRYDDQWAVGSVLLPDLDDLRAALAALR